MIRRAKFDAASFIIGGEIRNRINIQTNKKHTQTVNDKQTADRVFQCFSYCMLSAIGLAAVFLSTHAEARCGYIGYCY